MTTALGLNPLPFTVRVKPGPPTVALAGLSELIAGPVMGKLTMFEVTPPKTTFIDAVPIDAISVAGTAAVTWVALR